jgi:hypothetical protein
MPARKPFLKSSEPDEELLNLLEATKENVLSEEDIREQRVSFAFGNALGSDNITKESVRRASSSLRLQRGGT